MKELKELTLLVSNEERKGQIRQGCNGQEGRLTAVSADFILQDVCRIHFVVNAGFLGC